MLNIKHLKTSSYNLLVLSGVLWGLTPIIYKSSLLYVSVLGLITIRFLAGAAIMYATNHKKFRKLKSSQKLPVLMFGLFSAIALLWYIFGIERTTAMHASIISMTLPFMLYILVGAFLKERVHRVVILGSILATLGLAIILISTSRSADDGATLVGDLMLLMSMLFGAFSVLTAKQILKNDKKISSEQMVFMEYFVAGIISLFVLALSSQGLSLVMSISGLFWLILAITMAGVVPVLVFYHAIRGLPGERIGDTNFISPLVGFLAAALILGENLPLVSVLGASLVFIGLFVSNNKFKPIHTAHYIISLERGFLRRTIDLEKEVVDKAIELEKKAISAAKSSL